MNRRFRIESLRFHQREELTSVRNIARMNAYPSGEYAIYASDIEPEMIEKAKRNAGRAGVLDDITFSVSDFSSLSGKAKTIVTNPPYGKRLEDTDIANLYSTLESMIE